MRVAHAEYLRSAVSPEHFVRDGLPAIAFVGRSNVGKSSLLNRLLRRKGLARTSSTPGRTQAVNYFLIDRKLYFVDLPGYGYARAPKRERQRWSDVINAYLSSSEPRPLVVLLMDGRIGGTDLDRQALEYLQGLDLEVLVVATKIDKVPRGKRVRAMRTVRATLGADEQLPVLAVSAATGEGIDEIWKATTAFVNRHKKSLKPTETP